MINNRQNGRRRGRGGGSGAPRPNGSNGGQDRGNRIDNRARGNAAQLLEKYKALARDAQMQGDRVNTEYYLQFADHYFRVLSESRSRFEEQQPRQRRDEFSNADEEYGDEGDRIGGEQQPQQQQRRAPDPAFVARDAVQQFDLNDGPSDDGDNDGGEDRRPQRGRPARGERRYDTQPSGDDGDRGGDRDGERAEAAPVAAPSDEGEDRPVRRRGRPPKAKSDDQLDANVLPPSLSLQSGNDGDGDAPRPRTRRPRGETAAV